MGGGGWSPPERSDLDKLEQLAREKLKGESSPDRRNVFISFDYDDVQEVNLLRGQAKNENSDLVFNDWSLKEPFNSKKAEYIKKGISQKIESSSVTVVYISNNTANSRWVNWEINQSLKMGKGVVVVYKGNTPPARMPKAISDNRDKVTLQKWEQKGITKAIEDAAKNR